MKFVTVDGTKMVEYIVTTVTREAIVTAKIGGIKGTGGLVTKVIR